VGGIDETPQAGREPISLVRPYLLTSGRAQPVDQSLEIEAQVVTHDSGEQAAFGVVAVFGMSRGGPLTGLDGRPGR